MTLRIKIDEINYGDVAMKIQPLLGQESRKRRDSLGLTLGAISGLPEKLMRELFDTTSIALNNEILAELAMEHSNRVIDIINDVARRHQLGVVIGNYTLDKDLLVEMDILRINYLTIAEHFLPMVKENLLKKSGAAAPLVRPVIANANAEQVCALMDKLLGNNKNAFFASLINQNPQVLIDAIEKAAQEQNVRLKIGSIHAEED